MHKLNNELRLHNLSVTSKNIEEYSSISQKFTLAVYALPKHRVF